MIVEFLKLSEADIGSIEQIEKLTNLTFWGWESYRTLLADENYVFACAAKKSQDAAEPIIGFVLVRFIDREAEIMKIGVRPEYQKQGIGSQLLKLAVEESRSRQCVYCYLEVRKSNALAIRFYKEHGFELFGYRKNYYTNPMEDAYIMRIRLGK
jgi:ribosomal-protein-alanine N-acetyltransferase